LGEADCDGVRSFNAKARRGKDASKELQTRINTNFHKFYKEKEDNKGLLNDTLWEKLIATE